MDTDHHDELVELLEAAGLTQREAAEILSRATGDTVSLRTVQSWVNERGSAHARRCPGWAIYCLRRELQVLE